MASDLRILALVAVAALAVASEVDGQLTASVSGRVVGADTSVGITNASVELVGHGDVLTTPDGRFRFDGVPLREYVLHVSGLGYAPVNQFLDVQGDIVIEVTLEIAPLRLDSLLVVAREIDFDGRIRDPVRDTPVMDALVLTDQGHEEWTNQRGHFDIDDVLEGVPLRMRVRAFGYLPVDTTLIPHDQDRHDFDLVGDTLVERLIAAQHARIVQRADDHLYEYRPAFDRNALSRYSPSSSVASIMEARYPLHILRGVYCVVLDEQHVRTEHERRAVLLDMFPQEIERMELLEFTVGGGRTFMLRIYTRAFFQELIARNQPLRTASIHDATEMCT